MTADLAVIVTARNEADRLGATLRALRQTFPEAELWVADDGSSDATAHVALQEGARLVQTNRPRGKGGAATLAAEALLRESDPVVVLADADLGESAAQLRRLVDALGTGAHPPGADPARAHPPGAHPPDADPARAHPPDADPAAADLAIATFANRVGGGFGIAVGASRWAIRSATRRTMRAPMSGQRAMRPGVLGQLLPFAAGFGIETGMTIDALRQGLRVVEVELDLEHRATGMSLRGFLHRGRQARDALRAYVSRRA
jgi:glycosyltransferase involved in cell wall biosynthesis